MCVLKNRQMEFNENKRNKFRSAEWCVLSMETEGEWKTQEAPNIEKKTRQ
jgi:hypothetical protein